MRARCRRITSWLTRLLEEMGYDTIDGKIVGIVGYLFSPISGQWVPEIQKESNSNGDLTKKCHIQVESTSSLESSVSHSSLLLDATTVILLSILNRSLVALRLTLSHEAAATLERTGQVAGSGLAEHVNLDEVGLESALEGNDGLDEERVGVLHVQVHNTHHADAHQLTADQLAQLRLVVIHVGGSHGLGLLAAAQGSRLDVLKGRHVYHELVSEAHHWEGDQIQRTQRHSGGKRISTRTLFLIDLRLGVQVDSQDDHIGQDIQAANQHQNIGVFKGNLLGELHHHQDNGQICTVTQISLTIPNVNMIPSLTPEGTPFCRTKPL